MDRDCPPSVHIWLWDWRNCVASECCLLSMSSSYRLDRLHNKLNINQKHKDSKLLTLGIPVLTVSQKQANVMEWTRPVHGSMTILLTNSQTRVVLNDASFIKMSTDHLKMAAYKKVIVNPLDDLIHRVNDTLKLLYDLGAIKSIKLYRSLLSPQDAVLGKFRILPKLHKDKFSVRPIINCRNHPTSRLCAFC